MKRESLRANIRAVAAALACAIVVCVTGEAGARTPALPDIIARVEAAYNQATNFRADFNQDSTVVSMGKTIHEEGSVYIRKPFRMLWDYRTPSAKKLVINQDTASLYVPEERMVYLQAAPQILKSKITIRFLAGMGKIDDAFSAAFADAPAPGAASWRIALTPKIPEGGIKTLVVTVDAKSWHITTFEFTDMYNNTTRLRLSNIRTNTALPDSLFEFTPPPGTDIYRVP